jgi:hypothetical protein
VLLALAYQRVSPSTDEWGTGSDQCVTIAVK